MNKQSSKSRITGSTSAALSVAGVPGIRITAIDLEPNLEMYERGVNSKFESFARKCKRQLRTTAFAVKVAQRLLDAQNEVLVLNVARNEWVTVKATNLRKSECGTFFDWVVDIETDHSKSWKFLSEIRLPGQVELEYSSHEGELE